MTNHPGFVVVLRPTAGMTDEQATRALRAFLKSALRSYGLRCIEVTNETPNPEGTNDDQG